MTNYFDCGVYEFVKDSLEKNKNNINTVDKLNSEILNYISIKLSINKEILNEDLILEHIREKFDYDDFTIIEDIFEDIRIKSIKNIGYKLSKELTELIKHEKYLIYLSEEEKEIILKIMKESLDIYN